MNLKNQPPVFVPHQYQAEIEKFSKAALMDMVWDLATRAAGADELAVVEIMQEVRHTAGIVDNYRKQEAPNHRRQQKELKAELRRPEAEAKAWCPFCNKSHAGGATCMGHHP